MGRFLLGLFSFLLAGVLLASLSKASTISTSPCESPLQSVEEFSSMLGPEEDLETLYGLYVGLYVHNCGELREKRIICDLLESDHWFKCIGHSRKPPEELFIGGKYVSSPNIESMEYHRFTVSLVSYSSSYYGHEETILCCSFVEVPTVIEVHQPTITPVPLPSTVFLILSALGLGYAYRKKTHGKN